MTDSWEVAWFIVLRWTVAVSVVSVSITVTEAEIAIVITSSEVSALRLISTGVFVPLWVVICSDFWLFSINYWFLMGPLEKSSPNGHGVRISTIIFKVSGIRSWSIVVVVGWTLLSLLCNYWVVHDGYADPEWTAIVFATWASPFASFECSIIKIVVELLWIGNLGCIDAYTVIVFSIKGSVAVWEALCTALCASSSRGIFLIVTHV